MMDTDYQTYKRNIRLALVVIGVCVSIMVICIAVGAAEFNLTCNVSERYLYWHFDNDTYNISIDGVSAASNFTGTGYLVTNLRPNTMHMISIANFTNATTDYQTTQKTFWDTDFFIYLIIGIFLMLLGYGFKAWGFTMLAWFVVLFACYEAWTYWGTTNVFPITLGVVILAGVSFRWLTQTT